MLEQFAGIAGIGVAMNLAYLKLDRFRHRNSIEDCARSELKRLGDDKGTLDDYKDREYYKILKRLAGDDGESRTNTVRGPWFQIYRLLFLKRVDRGISYLMMGLSLATLLGSSRFPTIDESETEVSSTELFPLVAISPSVETALWAIISFAIVFSIFLVLYGDRMVRLARQEIQHSGSELEQYMAQPARHISVDIS